MKLIGFTGDAGCGKDEAATILFHKYRFKIEKFAKPIYEGLSAMLNVPVSVIEEGKRKGTCPPDLELTYRELLQTLGTEWGRDVVDSEIWTKLAKKRARNCIRLANKSVVFTDVRFDNEAKMILMAGGTIIKIIRPGHEKISKSYHVSESGVSKEFISDTIINDGSLTDLYDKVEDITLRKAGDLCYQDSKLTL